MSQDKKGLHTLMRIELQPIRTVGLPFWKKRKVALTESRRFVFIEDWPFTLPDGTKCIIPAGYAPSDRMQKQLRDDAFSSDGSSFPRLLRWIFSPFGVSIGAGVPHDFAYRYRCFLTEDGKQYMPEMEKYQADDFFKRINLQTNDIPELAYSTTFGLVVGGGFAWSQHRRHDGTPRNDISPYLAERSEQ